MIFDNVLDQSQSDKVEFRNCKLKYLKAENKLLTIQLDTVSKLVDLHKQVLNIATAKEEEVSTETIQILLDTANKMVQQCYRQCKQVLNQKDFFPQNQEGLITPSFFMQLVVSFQSTIRDLKQQIHHRQNLLQELQSNSNHPKKRQYVPQSKALTKAIESYDIYPRLSEKCREEIMQLKLIRDQRKKKEKQMAVFREISNQNTSNFSEIDKTVKIVPKTSPSYSVATEKTLPKLPVEQMSPFEKIILVYKKKKLFNDMLENKVISLKNKIHEKEAVNKLLRAKMEREAWDLGDPKTHAVEDGDATFLSVLNQTLKANNLDFSIDFSRVHAEPWKDGGEENQNSPILEGLEEDEIHEFDGGIQEENQDEDD